MIKNYKPQLFNLSNKYCWEKHLDEEGYVVIQNILDQTQIDIGLDLFWKDWMTVSPNFKKDNIKTWTSFNSPMLFGKGIAGFNNFGQSDFCWHIRLQEKIIEIFKLIHNTSELKCSFDGFSMFFTEEQQSKLWWHIDQNPNNPIYCIQGSYNFLTVDENDAGMVLVPKSHSSYFSNRKLLDTDINKDWITFKEEIIHDGVKLLIPANCFVLWNSRLIHSNTGIVRK